MLQKHLICDSLKNTSKKTLSLNILKKLKIKIIKVTGYNKTIFDFYSNMHFPNLIHFYNIICYKNTTKISFLFIYIQIVTNVS